MAGFGYWSGKDVRIEFRPAAAGSGIMFVRSDLGPTARVPATVEHRVECPRRTNLRCGAATVEMVEHVLAALAGLEIDNCEVWTNQAEMPGCDGSAAPFVDALLRARVVQQGVDGGDAAKSPRRFAWATSDCWIEAQPADDGELHIEYQLGLSRGRRRSAGRWRGRRSRPRRFAARLPAAGRLCWRAKRMQLRAPGLGLRVTTRDLLVFDEHGPIDNRLRFPTSAPGTRRSTCWAIWPWPGAGSSGRFVAYRSGHRLHAELTRQLVERFAAAPLRATA